MQNFDPILDGPFRGCSQMGGGGKKAPLLKISHISYNDETWRSYTLAKEDPKYESLDTPLSSADIGNQQVLLYQEKRYRLHFDK